MRTKTYLGTMGAVMLQMSRLMLQSSRLLLTGGDHVVLHEPAQQLLRHRSAREKSTELCELRKSAQDASAAAATEKVAVAKAEQWVRANNLRANNHQSPHSRSARPNHIPLLLTQLVVVGNASKERSSHLQT